MLDPKSLSVAVALAETGSVTEAARRMHLSQPAASYHVGKLEKAVGVSLFHRGAAGLTPTAEGRLLVSRAGPVLAELERLERDVRGLAAGEGRTLRLSSACFTNYHWLPEVLRDFRERHGRVRIALGVDPGRRPFEELDRGMLDLCLTTVPPDGAAFELHELFEDEIVLVLHPEHRLAGEAYVRPEDLEEESVVVFDRTQSDLFNLALAPAAVTPREVTDMPVTEAALELVRAGVAVSPMASWIAQPELDGGRLCALRIGPEGLHRTWFAVLSARRPTSAQLRSFLEALERVCAANPPSGAGSEARTGSAGSA